MTRRPLHVRLVVVLTTLLTVLVLPTVQANGAPPATALASRSVSLPGGDVAVALDATGVVALTAEVGDRPVELRWRTDGRWSAWVPFATASEHAPDPGTAELRGVDTDVSEPVWVGAADTVELRSADPGPLMVELVTVDGDLDYRADATPPASAEAFSVWPPIVPRDAWDPQGACAPTAAPRIAPRAERIFVHHTVVFPDYAPEEGDDVVRAVCLGHVNRRGFSDVGYNFLIDRYGVIYQGRDGGILQAVEGAHAQGFNTGSIGIALVGDFHAGTVPPAAARSLDQLTTWLADLHGIDPTGSGTAVSTGGSSTRYPEGAAVTLPNILGHRDTGANTACPGDHLYDIVRGTRPLAPRVTDRLVAEYGHHPDDGHGHGATPVATTASATTASAAAPAEAVPAPALSAEDLVRTVGAVVGRLHTGDVGGLVTRVLAATHAGTPGH